MENVKKKLLENGKKRMETGQSNVGSNNERKQNSSTTAKKNQKKQKS